MLAIDQDPAAIEYAQSAQFNQDPRFAIRFASFTRLSELVAEQQWMGQVNGIVLDLGVSSPQLDEAARGFSFRQAGPLDMRMNPEQGMSAADWLNRANEAEIARVLREYGEEKFARRIARAIVATRRTKPLETTLELANLISECVPVHEANKHPATRSFQGIRIYINQELEALKRCLEQCLQVLKVGGRLAVISFHSLEDKIVKEFFQKQASGDVPEKLPLRDAQIKRHLKIISRLIRCSEAELMTNPRARSARLRVGERT